MSDGECSNCKRLEKRLEEMEARLEELERKLAAAAKNSSNSSKPPSSDIVKPPRSKPNSGVKGSKKRKKGGQKGHDRSIRPALPDDEFDWLMQYSYETCPDCGGPLTVDEESPAQTLQQMEFVTQPIQATEHQALACHCSACRKTHVASIPAAVRKCGLCGPQLTSIIGLLRGSCHASLGTIRKYLQDVYDLTLSRGFLAKVIAKVSDAIAPLYDGLFEQLKIERVLNVDETGHRDSGTRMWTWCFRAGDFTVFRTTPVAAARCWWTRLAKNSMASSAATILVRITSTEA